MEPVKMGNYFEDFTKGQLIEHQLSKTLTESDNNLFCLLTMNHHPLHLNHQYAENSQHQKVVVVGTLVFSLVVGMTVPDISGKAIANLLYEEILHLAPVFIGDTLYARTRILEITPSKSKADRGVVYVETIASNQNQIDVLKFRRKVLIKRKP
jgi:acyl dehydratase